MNFCHNLCYLKTQACARLSKKTSESCKTTHNTLQKMITTNEKQIAVCWKKILNWVSFSPVTENRVDVLQSPATKATSPESSAWQSLIVSVYCLSTQAMEIRESPFNLSPLRVQYASAMGCSSSTQKMTVSLTGTTVLRGSFLVMLPGVE